MTPHSKQQNVNYVKRVGNSCCHSERMTSYKNLTQSINEYYSYSKKSGVKFHSNVSSYDRALSFLRGLPNSKNDNKMRSGMISSCSTFRKNWPW